MAGRAHRSSAGQSARRRAPTIATQPSSTSITPSWDALRRDIKPVYAAVTAAAARAALDELAELWGQRYGAIIRLWANAWEQFIPFLDYDTEIRKVICSTDAIESLNARYRRAVRARGHFPSETGRGVQACPVPIGVPLGPGLAGRP
jgi:putative transposase